MRQGKPSGMMRRLGGMLLVAALGGCAVLNPAASDWPAIGQDYVQRLRWHDTTGAAAYLSEELRDGFLRDLAAWNELQIVDTRLESFDLREEGTRAETIIALDYHRLTSATVKTLRLHQQWAYQGATTFQSGTWRIVTPFPAPP